MNLPDDTPFLVDSAARAVCDLITNAEFRVYFVGGCVRNAVLGEAQSDIDLSTNALPQQVLDLAKDAGVKAVPTGIDHGTVTLVVDETPFEVTTFRRDIETDGRRAVVAFSDKIEEDALRRDFTMNALYATPEGEIVDPLGGIPDAMARRVVFIQDARARIREDYLRSLRFFRFWAWYGDKSLGFDPETLSAIGDTLHGLETLSAERIGAELLKLLAAPDPAQAVATMAQLGIFTRLLPIQDTAGLFRLWSLKGGPKRLRTRCAGLPPLGRKMRPNACDCQSATAAL
jgi:poly(A) polymerase